MNRFHVVFVLDRHPRTIDILSQFTARHTPVVWCKAGMSAECRDIRDIFSVDAGWPYHKDPWYLFYEENVPARPVWLDSYEHHALEDRTEVLQELAKCYSWAILPWGREEPMALIAFVTADEQYYNEFVTAFEDDSTRVSRSGLFLCDIATGSAPLLLTAYKNITSLSGLCHGLLFNDRGTAQRLWEFTDSGKNPPYVLHYRQVGPNVDQRNFPAGRSELLETYSDKRPIVRVLLRVYDQETLAAYLPNWGTALVIPGTADLQRLRVLFQRPAFTIHTAPDYATRLISCADWVCFPESGLVNSLMYETFISRSAQVVSSFLNHRCAEPLCLFSCF